VPIELPGWLLRGWESVKKTIKEICDVLEEPVTLYERLVQSGAIVPRIPREEIPERQRIYEGMFYTAPFAWTRISSIDLRPPDYTTPPATIDIIGTHPVVSTPGPEVEKPEPASLPREVYILAGAGLLILALLLKR